MFQRLRARIRYPVLFQPNPPRPSIFIYFVIMIGAFKIGYYDKVKKIQ